MTASSTKKLTKRTVDALRPNTLVWDTDVKGFGVRRQKEARVYVLKTRVRGKQRWFSIGPHGSPWTVEGARKEAKHLLGVIADGGDPARDRDSRRNQPTISELADRYLEEHAKEHKKASSYKTDASNIENHIKPLLGKVHVADVGVADVDRMKRAIKDGKTARKQKEEQRGGPSVTGGPIVANRCLALLSKMLSFAEKHGLKEGSNPCRHVAKYKENRRERQLSPKELATLGETLNNAAKDQSENEYVIAAIRLLIFTGARLGEILSLRWEYVDLEGGKITLPDSKTGKKIIFLSAPALEVLATLTRIKKNPHVIVGHIKGAHMVNIQKPWGRIRKAAKLPDLRLHDLRHSFASIAVTGGLSLPMIGKLLGHSKTSTTERYAHLADDPIKAANELIGGQIAAAMKGQGGKVVKMKKQKA